MEHFVGIMFEQRLRTPTDRQAVQGIFKKVWGRSLQPQERPSMSVNAHTVQVGRAILPRVDRAAARSSAEGASQSAAASLRLLGSQLQPLEAAMQVLLRFVDTTSYQHMHSVSKCNHTFLIKAAVLLPSTIWILCFLQRWILR